MTEEKESLSGEESLKIINEMIARARRSIQQSAYYFILWDWIVAAGSLGHYILLEFSGA